jgi:hypothetical protein
MTNKEITVLKAEYRKKYKEYKKVCLNAVKDQEKSK